MASGGSTTVTRRFLSRSLNAGPYRTLQRVMKFTSSEGEADERTDPGKETWDLNRKTLGRGRDDRI